jgi:tripartite-type tricarboxylate transporter receptor subunit TctC
MHRRTLLAATAGTLTASRAQAQSWPTRPVRVVEPGLPGGGNDTTIRLFAPHLERALGQPFVVENRAGAGGRLGVETVFRAAPDGSTPRSIATCPTTWRPTSRRSRCWSPGRTRWW